MARQIEALARFVAETPWEAIPPAVQQRSKLVFLDTLGVILAGALEPEVVNLTARLATPGSHHEATIYAAGFPTADVRTAALLNGIAGRTLELCETHRYAFSQSAAQATPTILAVGEARRGTGQEALAALVLSYEVAVRTALATKRKPLAHHNGQFPLMGAVAAGARMRGLDAMQLDRALRIGANLVLTPTYANTVVGGTALNVAGGMSGLVGTLAPELTLAGFQARDDAVELAFSELVGEGFDPTHLADGLGDVWEITRSQIRLRSCCTPIYAALDALEEILSELAPGPDEIERIDVATWAFAANMKETEPVNAFAARYSLPHAAAAIVLLGHAGRTAFDESRLHDPAFVALRRRVSVTEDPALTAVAPRLKPGRVTVTLRDGRAMTRTCESPRGDYQRPYTDDELLEKFRELSRPLLSDEGVEAVMRLVDRFDGAIPLDELPRLVRQHARHA
ncbi:MAG: MmgE/PrpD family protein [Chloroflexi bacterium]|nr:MmgE/PrpD family protein [Chloroflexota bacterium]